MIRNIRFNNPIKLERMSRDDSIDYKLETWLSLDYEN